MSFDPLTALFDAGKMFIERKWPDKHKQAEEVLKLKQLVDAGNERKLIARVGMLSGQMEVNKVEAAHKSIFVAGWRPFIGWVGGVALSYHFVVYPLLSVVVDGMPEPMEYQELYTLITGMLGIAGMRTLDKIKGVDTRDIKVGK